jgi:4-amino-4-deoxy-L-arabinose transferase-like glycosyltransferase
VTENAATWLDRLLRPGTGTPRDIRIDLCWLLGLGLLMIGAGFGLRDPWPADEPRFALIARDMLASGDWLFPRVGGDLYADKPPFYFWQLAASMALTGSVRAGFLLPALLAGLGTMVLVYDLLRRTRDRETAFAGALLLLATFQFVWQARQAQVDASLCLLTTLSLYGLLRFLLTEAHLRWWLIGWAAAGLGVITKGVGFLPLLVLVPGAVLARRGWSIRMPRGVAPWLAGPGAFLAAIAVWFVPMWIATSSGGELTQYRNELLFHQTLARYASAWHHNEPVWYYFVSVIPFLWLPAIALLPWAWPRWREALRSRDALVGVLLGWVAIVLVFFSVSSGKRGVYVLPALPAYVAALAPFLPELLRTRGPRRLALALAGALCAVTATAAVYFSIDDRAAAELVAEYGGSPVLPLAIVAVCGSAIVLLCRLRDAWLAWLGALGVTLATIGFVVYPRIDASRSARSFVARVERATASMAEIGWIGAREQYLLHMRRPSVNFGHSRWRERADEIDDAAAWLAASSNRALLIDRDLVAPCFGDDRVSEIDEANRNQWVLVTGVPESACVERGDASRAIVYVPPM